MPLSIEQHQLECMRHLRVALIVGILPTARTASLSHELSTELAIGPFFFIEAIAFFALDFEL